MVIRPDHRSLAAIAAECGYADQAHMAREWRTLAGASPTQWLADERLPFVQDDEGPAGASSTS
jgi:AraC-like DNA-binding protein